MIRVEPKLLLMEKDTLQLKESIYLDNQKIGKTSEELAATIQNLEATESQLKEKELQWSQLKRCHLCAGEDLAQGSHHVHKKGFAKREAGVDVEGGQADGSLGTPASEVSQKGHGHKDQKSKGTTSECTCFVRRLFNQIELSREKGKCLWLPTQA